MLVHPVRPTSTAGDYEFPTEESIARTRAAIADHCVVTPSVGWPGDALVGLLGPGTDVSLKLELFQRTGSFKARGALVNVLALDPEERTRGITAVSAGNHAIAVAWAAALVGVSAKVVMIGSANPRRVELTRSYGAEVVIAGSPADAFGVAASIVADEGRTMVHPFEGPSTVLGTATVGAEFLDQVPDLEIVIVPVGGGGLIAGVAAALKDRRPDIAVYGVEPVGADSMTRSFAAGAPQAIERVTTIADSLGAPFALPYSYACAAHFVDAMVIVTDEEIRDAMRLMALDAKLVAEPAAAAGLAAIIGPLREVVVGKHVGLIVCGANIDIASYTRLVADS